MKVEYLEQMRRERNILNGLYKSVYNNTLTEYIKSLDDDVLDWLYSRLGANDIEGNALPIYEVIRIEMEYRKSNSNKKIK